ncbi:uncharacterized protein LOC108197716 [Daucus carota subsp. sativus]|uniref:uncharacterized protein LOC108197716 n=1 Tax=Daucus carota subsp. sativus TaxID=79200 RepID=UPI0007EF0567|nr:PREDICTED: uncharacterized protein LOC108197716 [Daucus carota subsp. sativus]XP_017220895.1 PREDICTED: uncharacterized protein LOC108197716 [Daucus carota subsp. sativus]
MAHTTTFIFVALLFLFLQTCWCDTIDDLNLAPIFSPIFDNVCKAVECGKGSCKASQNSTFFFSCECEPGWKQSFSDDDGDFRFLPCIIPNCSMDYSCTHTKAPAPAPVQDEDKPTNASIFDPCRWADCGGGKCNKTAQFQYTCQCEKDYYNLLNATYLPCLRDCALGADCANLGISILKPSSSASPSTLPDKNSNRASAMPVGIVEQLTMVVLLVFIIQVAYS